MQKNKDGFTLLELLITTSLIAMMGLAIYAAFAKGVAVWELGNETDKQEKEIRFALDKMAAELRNSFNFSRIVFGGTKEQIEFSTYIVTHPATEGSRTEPGRVTYFFDPARNALLRIQERYVDIFQEERPEPKEFIAQLTGFEFGYYYFDPANNVYGWMDSWEGRNDLPLGVKINLKLKDGAEERSFVKTVYFRD